MNSCFYIEKLSNLLVNLPTPFKIFNRSLQNRFCACSLLMHITLNCLSVQILISSNIRGAYNKFPDSFCMDTFIDSTHMKL